MLLQNCLVLFSIYCMVYQDADAFPGLAKISPILSSPPSDSLNVTKGKDQANDDSAAKLAKAIKMFPKRLNYGLPSDKKKGFQLWAKPETETVAEAEAEAETETVTAPLPDSTPVPVSTSVPDSTSVPVSLPVLAPEAAPNEVTGSDSKTPAPDGSESTTGSGNDTTISTDGNELTVSIPKFNTDKMGNWVYNPWGVTFGQVWLDTRFNFGDQATMARMVINSRGVTNYYPRKERFSTVCMGKSTVYNRPRIEKWLPRKIPQSRYVQRPIVMEMRRELYKSANSEECHVPKLKDWMSYQLCALRRNQRMEYFLPKYPMQQL